MNVLEAIKSRMFGPQCQPVRVGFVRPGGRFEIRRQELPANLNSVTYDTSVEGWVNFQGFIHGKSTLTPMGYCKLPLYEVAREQNS